MVACEPPVTKQTPAARLAHPYTIKPRVTIDFPEIFTTVESAILERQTPHANRIAQEIAILLTPPARPA
jgi:hypothetical protein